MIIAQNIHNKIKQASILKRNNVIIEPETRHIKKID